MTEYVLTIEEDRGSDGPAMSRLNDRERAFVCLMIQTGCSERQAGQCATAAGYANGTVSGWQLMRRSTVLAAMKEEAGKRLIAGALLGVNVMMEIAMTINHKDRYKAAKDLAAINGFSPVSEQKITVEHIGTDATDVLAEIEGYAKTMGMEVDRRQLLAHAGVVVDAEFTAVEEDWSVG